MATRRCRACGQQLPAEDFRRCAGASGARRRTCRSCEGRQRTRRWLVSSGRPVRPEYLEPELTMGDHLRIIDAERGEQHEGYEAHG